MSFIKIQHIVSVSSEDKNFPAENLLKQGEYKKWKCEKGGQKQASVVLQFEKASKINSVDIGNEGSAFIEVLVGRLSDMEQNYQVLLVASSFMSPKESRDGTNSNRVRMFGSDKFMKGVVDEKWDRVKIVCTQPFNKTAQYGLAFIKFHSTTESSHGKQPQEVAASQTKATTEASPKIQRLGSFTLKDDCDDSPLVPGSFFAKRKDTSPLKGALEIRAASAKAEMLASKATYSVHVATKRKTDTTNETEPESKKVIIETSPKTLTTKPSSFSLTPPSTSQKPPPSDDRSKAKIATTPVPPKESKGETDVKAKVPFKKLLADVVFALSGFQNPYRSDLRDKALEMGAKYRPDWDDTCTHLICAFPNTPKFQQVKQVGGKIVSKQWILDCHKQKTALPWRKYKLQSNGNSSSSDEDSDDSSALKNQKITSPSKTSQLKNENLSEKANTKQTPDAKAPPGDDDDDDYGGSTDVDSLPSGGNGSNSDTELEYDTEDELRRVMEGANSKNGKESTIVDTSEMPLPELPDYFHGSGFFLYGSFESAERRTLVRYIVAFNGKLEEYMNEKVAYVITKSEWDDNFDEALSSNENLIFVKPKWIHVCAEKQKGVPHQPFIIVPKD